MALAQIGNTFARNKQSQADWDKRMALEEWRDQRQGARDAEERAWKEQQAEKSRQTQLDVANIYGSRNGAPNGLEAEAEGWETPEFQEWMAGQQAIIDDPEADPMKRLAAADQLKGQGSTARRFGMMAWKKRQTGGQGMPQPTGQQDDSTTGPGHYQEPDLSNALYSDLGRMVGGNSPISNQAMQSIRGQQSEPGFFGRVYDQMTGQLQNSGALPPAAGVAPRSQAQFGGLRDALQRMLRNEGSPADEALLNEFFGNQPMPGPQLPQPITPR